MPPEKADDLRSHIRELEARLEDAEETLRALRSGEVDAIVAPGPDGDRVYTLRGADETYRAMVQGMAEGALTLTIDGLILFSNEQFATMIGVPLARVIGRHFQDFACADDVGVVALLLGGTGGKAEVRLQRSDDALLPAYLSVQRLAMEGIDCNCMIVTDLSAQKRYEEIVALMEAVPAGVFIAQDAECKVVVGNRMAYELLGLPVRANVSKSAAMDERPKSWREVKDGRDVPAGELPMQVAARTGEPVHGYEFDIIFDDGRSRCWLGNAVPLFDETRRPRGAVGAFVDISDRKRATEALEASNAELLSFASALTHDLQEPMSLVVKSTQLLANEVKGKLGEEVERLASSSVESALRMKALLKGLLVYWEVTERYKKDLSPVDCNDLLLQVVLNLQPEILASGAVVTSAPLPTLVADEMMLLQVFENLIDNAIKCRSEAAPAIHFAAVRTGERWLFTVRDNGIGIGSEDVPFVFDIFKRAHDGKIPGAGIGLALCKKVIERHGGRIWVESRRGEGASFRFTLPIYLDSALPGFASQDLAPKSLR